MAELTGLEPATSRVTGERSNQLSYNSVIVKRYSYRNSVLDASPELKKVINISEVRDLVRFSPHLSWRIAI